MEIEKKKAPKPFIGINFKCCKVYSRIYLNHKRTAFIGHCPRCAARVEVLVSPTGSKSRFFMAD